MGRERRDQADLQKYAQQKLVAQHYQDFVVADLGSFRGMVKHTQAGYESMERLNAYNENRLPQTRSPNFFPPKSPDGFIRRASDMNKKETLISECSNYAYHSAGVLMDDPKIREGYDIAVVGIMGGKHNITVMLPKGEPVELDSKRRPPDGYQFPEGTLIVDPWAVGMGNPPERALAVKPQDFEYKNSLYNKLTFNFQSSAPQHQESLSELPSQSTLEPPPPQAIAKPRPTPPIKHVFPKSYDNMWNSVQQSSGGTNQQQVQQIRKLLNDYTKDNSWFKRVISGHWNRHHVKEVANIVKDIDSGKLKSAKEITAQLDKVGGSGKKVNPTGSFRKRLDFIKEKTRSAEQTQEAENTSQRRFQPIRPGG